MVTITTLKYKLKYFLPFYKFYTAIRAKWFEVKAAHEMAHYARLAEQKEINYSQEAAKLLLQERLASRGLFPKPKNELHIFAFIRYFNWEKHNLIPALEKFGHVTHFDWHKEGYDEFSPIWGYQSRKKMNNVLLDAVNHVNKNYPIDLFFAYAMDCHLERKTIAYLNRMGIITVNMTLNDHHAFWGRKIKGLWWGVAPFVSAFDLNCTCNTKSFEKYLVEGGIPFFFPEAANPNFYRPLGMAKDIDISFVGKRYGHRPFLIHHLQKHGIKVETFGSGWPNGEISASKMVEIFNRSRINLGIGGVGYSKKIVDIKGRDFEIPMSGGLYLTQYNPELELCFRIGEEIVCYNNKNDLVEKIHFLLSHPEHATAIRLAGHKRALRDHTWEQRFEKLFSFIGLGG